MAQAPVERYSSGSGPNARWHEAIGASFTMSLAEKSGKINSLGARVPQRATAASGNGIKSLVRILPSGPVSLDQDAMSSPERDGPRTPATSAGAEPAALRLRILGRVQGVGFRPFVARLAMSCHLTGWVKNTPEGVVAHVEGTSADLADFGVRLRGDAPPAAEIHAGL